MADFINCNLMKFQFDFKTGNENRITKTQPSTVIDNGTELVYLDENDAMIDVIGKVPKPGLYTFIVHYYQPDHPGRSWT